MAQTTTSHAGRLPITDGRSAEAQYIRRLRAELRQHVGGAPTIAQRLLIDRIVNIALRLHALDCEPILLENGDYLELTRMLTELLAQLSDQPAPASIVHRPASCTGRRSTRWRHDESPRFESVWGAPVRRRAGR